MVLKLALAAPLRPDTTRLIQSRKYESGLYTATHNLVATFSITCWHTVHSRAKAIRIDFLCMMDLKSIRKINLIEQLSECYPHVEDLSSEEIHAWDENQIRAYYTESQEPQNRDRSAFADDHVRFGSMQLMPNHYQR